MNLQPESLVEQLLHHQFCLRRVELPRRICLRLNVPFVRVHPTRLARYLPRWQVIREAQNEAEREILDEQGPSVR
jgi:hypothetical protein